nr:expressed protein [Hymenolepis microstoma]
MPLFRNHDSLDGRSLLWCYITSFRLPDRKSNANIALLVCSLCEICFLGGYLRMVKYRSSNPEICLSE